METKPCRILEPNLSVRQSFACASSVSGIGSTPTGNPRVLSIVGAERSWLRPCASGIVAIACASYYATWSLLLHRSYHSNGWDLGIIDQVVWNTAHGRWFEYSFRDVSYVGDHWQPILLLLVPLKWVSGGPELLLVVQAAVLGAATIPLYFAARRLIGNEEGAWAVVAAYSLGLGVTRAVAFDLHAEAFVPLLVFTGLWTLATERRGWFVASSLAVLLVKEDGFLVVVSCAWVAAIAFDHRRPALFLVGTAVAYGAIVNIWLMPHYRGNDLNPLAERFGYLGGSIPEIAYSIFARPDLLVNQLASAGTFAAVLWLLLGVALLPLAAPRLLPSLLLVTLPPLLSQQGPQSHLELHYLLVPATVALVIATLVMRNLAGSKAAGRLQPAAVALITLAAVSLFMWRAPLPPSFAGEWDRFDIDQHARASNSIVAMIPPGAAVSAQSAFVPHLAERVRIYQFPRVVNARFVVTDKYGPIPANDLAAGYWPCLQALPRLGFDVIGQEDGISLWEKRRSASSVPNVPFFCSAQLLEGNSEPS